MTQLPPNDLRPYELTYQSASPHRNAPLLVKLAAIFNLVASGVDFLFAIGMIVLVIVMISFATPPVAPARPGAPPGPTPAEAKLIVALVYGIPGVLSLITAIIKCIGGIILLRRKKHAWVWGLIIGIVGCIELWTFIPCCFVIIIPFAAGIYTIVIICLPITRNYLQDQHSPPASL